MFSSKNKNNSFYKYFYIFCLFLLLIILPLIFSNNFNINSGSFYIFPNLALAGAVFLSAYLDVYSGWVASYILFYIYGSMTPLNPAIFGFSGTLTYTVSYFIWRKIPFENAIMEILITFIASYIFYLILFLTILYGLKIDFIYWNFLFSYVLPVSITTALVSPAVFYIFKKAGLGNFLNRRRPINI